MAEVAVEAAELGVGADDDNALFMICSMAKNG